MNVWLFQTGEQLPLSKNIRKMRTAIVADKLLERNHKIIWWSSSFEHQRKIMISKKDTNYNISENYKIRLIKGCGYKKNISIRRYIDHLFIAYKFRFQSKKYQKPDIIVASMPDHHLAYEAARYAKMHQIPIIIDIRDLWPDIFLRFFKKNKIHYIGKILIYFDTYRLYFLLNNATSLVSVSNEYLRWALKKIGKRSSNYEKVYYIGYKKNSFRVNALNQKDNSIKEILKQTKNKKRIIYIGSFGKTYDLESIIEVAKTFNKYGKKEIAFILAGTGEKYKVINKNTKNLENVYLTGWLNNIEIERLLSFGYAGLLCYVKNAPQSLPNKPFEYLSAGLPLINSLKGEMANLIERYCLGINYLPGKTKELFYAINKITKYSSLHKRMSKNAKEFYRNQGDAEKIYYDYATHIELVAKK